MHLPLLNRIIRHPVHSVLMQMAIGLLLLVILYLAGYTLNANSTKLAKHIVENQLDPERCGKMIILDLFGPVQAQHRRHCYYEVAQLLKDPTICLGLMPSEYGRHCMAEINGRYLIDGICNKIDNELQCTRDAYDEGSSFIDIYPVPNLQNCNNVQPEIVRDWCIASIASQTQPYNTNRCDGITSISRFTACISTVAWMADDIEMCNVISDIDSQIRCSLPIQMRKQYPSLYEQ